MRLAKLIAGLVLFAACRANGAVTVVNGPTLGSISDTTIRVWLQLSTSANVAVKVSDRTREVARISSDVDGPSPFIFDMPIGGLDPNKFYRLDLSIDGKPVNLPQPLSFTTLGPPGDAAVFSIAFGSGLDPKKNAEALFKSVVQVVHPRAFLFLGDTGLLPAAQDAFPVTHAEAFRMFCNFHKETRSTPELRTLMATTPCYATWDDRDFGPAGAARDFVHAKESLVAFTTFWPNPDYGTPKVPGVFCNFTFADADFFMLDDRFYRDPVNKNPGANPATHPTTAPAAQADHIPAMLGPGQIDWLKDKLTSSTARFKIIACGNRLLGNAGPDPSWADYPEERAAFLKWLFANKITGVVFISGGASCGQLTTRKADPKNSLEYTLVDLTSSTLSADTPPAAPAANKPLPAPGGVVTDHNFGELEFGGPRTRRFVTLRLRDSAGRVNMENGAKIETVLYADALKPLP